MKRVKKSHKKEGIYWVGKYKGHVVISREYKPRLKVIKFPSSRSEAEKELVVLRKKLKREKDEEERQIINKRIMVMKSYIAHFKRQEKKQAQTQAQEKREEKKFAARWEVQLKARKRMARRTSRAQGIDLTKRAQRVLEPTYRNLKIWAKQPNRYDMKGIDTPGSVVSSFTSFEQEQLKKIKARKRARRYKRNVKYPRVKIHRALNLFI